MTERSRLHRKRPKKKTSAPKDFNQQILSEDYWEGFYAVSDTLVVKCTDLDGKTAEISSYSLTNGAMTQTFQIPFTEGTPFSVLSEEVSNHGIGHIIIRISNAVEHPDRHDAIESILMGADRFELLRIQNLVRRLRSRGLTIFGGPIGSQDLFFDDYEGFYLLSDGNILYCRDKTAWAEDMMDQLVDGVVSYYIIDPRRFSLESSGEQLFGFLRGDRFSELAEHINRDHGRVTAELAAHGTELFGHMRKALGGDKNSAAIASHRLKMDLCLPR